MVSDRKLRFFQKRLEQIAESKKSAVKSKYPEIRTDYAALIGKGAGKLKSEAEIREAIACNGSRYSCPPVVEVLHIFDMAGEKRKAEEAEDKRKKAMNEELDLIKAHVKAATDLVYFGTDEQLKAALDELEAI